MTQGTYPSHQTFSWYPPVQVAAEAFGQPNAGRPLGPVVMMIRGPEESLSQAYDMHEDLCRSMYFHPLKKWDQLKDDISGPMTLIPGAFQQLHAVYDPVRPMKLRTLKQEILGKGAIRADLLWWYSCHITKGLLDVARWMDEGKTLHMLFLTGSVWIYDNQKHAGKRPHVALCAMGPYGDKVEKDDLSWGLGHMMIEMLTGCKGDIIGEKLQSEQSRLALIQYAQNTPKVMLHAKKRPELGSLLEGLTSPMAETRTSLGAALETLKLLSKPDSAEL